MRREVNHNLSCYLCVIDHQPALGARLHVLTAERLPQPHLHLHPTSRGLTPIHHLKQRWQSIGGRFERAEMRRCERAARRPHLCDRSDFTLRLQFVQLYNGCPDWLVTPQETSGRRHRTRMTGNLSRMLN